MLPPKNSCNGMQIMESKKQVIKKKVYVIQKDMFYVKLKTISTQHLDMAFLGGKNVCLIRQ